MNRSVRLWVVTIAGLAVAVAFGLAFVGLPSFGGSSHPYRTAAVHAAVAHQTANVVSSVNFDQRGLDTLGEETILFASVIGVSALLRPSQEEQDAGPSDTGRVLGLTQIFGYAVIPLVCIIGLDVIAHGQLTPGGGFQGGIIVASGIHLLYVAGSYSTLDKLRPVALFEHGEAVGAAAFACLGVAGAATTMGFLGNVLPRGTFGQLYSAGSVPLLNGAVGVEVASGAIVLVAKFLDQAILLGPKRG
ncbi:MAG TPA: MnhB domain-containing protein [Mycobacteriales bacterium]|nr:MnhB domain-containing protein [Mycobacteriales bacterium]